MKGINKTNMTAKIKISSTFDCEDRCASAAAELVGGPNAATNPDRSFDLGGATLAFRICGAAFQLLFFFGLFFRCFKSRIP
jgi:hypothetical protein